MESQVGKAVGRKVCQDLAQAYVNAIDSEDANTYYESPVMFRMMPNLAGMRVLDAGCGPGVYSEWLLDHGAEVTGVDCSEAMIELAKERTKGRGAFHIADLSGPMGLLPDSEFDMVVCPLVLDYIRDWVPTLKEFNRVLQDRGRLLFSCGHPCSSRESDNLDNYFAVREVEDSWGAGFSKRFSMPRFHRSLSSIFSTLTQSGFQVDRVVEPEPTQTLEETDPDFCRKLLRQPLSLCVLSAKTGLPRNRVIEVVPYDKEWPLQFVEIRNVLSRQLGPIALAIEHVGSTSVPGLSAKPILDIDIVISSRDDLPEAVKALSALGYYHQGDGGVVGREQFAHQDEKVPWDGYGRTWPRHTVYMCDKRCPQLVAHLALRNYLRQNPVDAKRYGDVKTRAASLYPHDIQGYWEGKAECVELILTKAKGLEYEIARQLDALDS
jgi:GrpB-like predicted nucleotidyltransferase (UPF0157 family)/protein-L-isoaspartate O-methyltransferase